MIEIHQLHVFTTVADEGNFDLAAGCLNKSRKDIISCLNDFEDKLGLELFQHTPDGVILTEDGAVLKGHADNVIHEADAFLFKARSLQDEIIGDFKLGSSTFLNDLHTHKLVELVEADNPKLKLQLVQSSSSEIIRNIKASSFDGGYVFGENCYPGNLEFLPLEQCDLLIVGPIKWKEEICDAGWSELVAFPWVWASHSCPRLNFLKEIFEKRNLHLTASAFTKNEKSLSPLIIAGAGMGLIPESEARYLAKAGEVCIWEKEKFSMKLFFAYKKSRNIDPAIQVILANIKQNFEVD